MKYTTIVHNGKALTAEMFSTVDIKHEGSKHEVVVNMKDGTKSIQEFLKKESAASHGNRIIDLKRGRVK